MKRFLNKLDDYQILEVVDGPYRYVLNDSNPSDNELFIGKIGTTVKGLFIFKLTEDQIYCLSHDDFTYNFLNDENIRLNDAYSALTNVGNTGALDTLGSIPLIPNEATYFTGESLEKAQDIGVNYTLDVTQLTAGVPTYFKFTPPATTSYTIASYSSVPTYDDNIGGPDAVDSYVEVYDSEGTLIGENDDFDGGYWYDFLLNITLTEDEYCYFKVVLNDNTDLPFKITLTETTNLPGPILTLDVPIQESLYFSEHTMYKFTAPATGYYTFVVNNLISNPDPGYASVYTWLFDTSYNYIFDVYTEDDIQPDVPLMHPLSEGESVYVQLMEGDYLTQVLFDITAVESEQSDIDAYEVDLASAAQFLIDYAYVLSLTTETAVAEDYDALSAARLAILASEDRVRYTMLQDEYDLINELRAYTLNL